MEDLEDGRAEEVHADRDAVALRALRLLLEADDPPVRPELRHAEPVRIGDRLEDRAGPGVAGEELIGEAAQRATQDVVAEDDGQWLIRREAAQRGRARARCPARRAGIGR